MARTMERPRKPIGETADGVTAAKSELCRRFALTGGTTARAADYALLLPNLSPHDVEAALEALSREGVVQPVQLTDGSRVYHFPRR